MTEALTTVLAGLKRGEVKMDDLAKPFNKFSDTIDNVLSKGTATFSWRELVNGGPLPDNRSQRLPAGSGRCSTSTRSSPGEPPRT